MPGGGTISTLMGIGSSAETCAGQRTVSLSGGMGVAVGVGAGVGMGAMVGVGPLSGMAVGEAVEVQAARSRLVITRMATWRDIGV